MPTCCVFNKTGELSRSLDLKERYTVTERAESEVRRS